ncbi:hypothetical protein [Adhaeribacter soli]|uniref:Uncharacterized protein n=1 Tax=Adhaeribacter soli TaxID=2607655 RepID=A0A5N1J591_9BACT|nr:hypothetical protein [Adhaeribacter soli]KAA9345887.1 hypothetical protein F0P94_02050 [Adhaeribacter soli]
MMNKINRFTSKYGSVVMISVGILFICMGLYFQFNDIQDFETYNHRSRTITKTPNYISYFIGIGAILIGIKNKWIFKKKPKFKDRQGKLIMLKSENDLTDTKHKRRKNKVIKLDNDITLRIDKE